MHLTVVAEALHFELQQAADVHQLVHVALAHQDISCDVG